MRVSTLFGLGTKINKVNQSQKTEEKHSKGGGQRERLENTSRRE